MSYDNDVTETFRRVKQSQINRICKSFSENPYDKEDRDYIEEAENVDLEKGVYKDNYENRKLGRVGQQFGGKKEEPDKAPKQLGSKKEDNFNIHDAIEDSLKGTHNDSNVFRERLFNVFKKSGYKNVRKFIDKEASDNMDAGEAYRAQIYIDRRNDGESKEKAIDTMKNSWKGLTGDDWNDPDAKDKTKKAFDEDEDYIEESEDVDLEKGVYKDNYKNRKLGRVGQQFGGRKKEEGNHEEGNSSYQKNIDSKKHEISGSKFFDAYNEIINNDSDTDYSDLLGSVDRYIERHKLGLDNGKTQEEDFDKLSPSHKEALTKLMNTAYKRFKNKSNVKKAMDLDEEDGIEKDEKTDIEKSQLFDSISDYNNSIKFEKTGKEVKDQITNIVLPSKMADLKIAEANADTFLEDCGDKPARNVEPYWLEGLDVSVPYFIYDYDELRECPSDNESVSNSITPPTINYASDSDQITARRNYNDTVRQICGQIVDIVACNTILKNLKDNVKLSLTPRQMVAFQFDK